MLILRAISRAVFPCDLRSVPCRLTDGVSVLRPSVAASSLLGVPPWRFALGWRSPGHARPALDARSIVRVPMGPRTGAALPSALCGWYSDAHASLAWRARIIQTAKRRPSSEGTAAGARVFQRGVTCVSLLDRCQGAGAKFVDSP
jgi:hypothetical protein